MSRMSDPRVEAAAGADPHAGGPARLSWAGAPLRSTLTFLAFPAVLAVAILALDVSLPAWALYGVGGVLGVVLLARVFRDPEWLLAAFVLYIPLKKVFSVALVPGVNGTNALLALLLLAWATHAHRAGRPLFGALPSSRLVGVWCALTLGSVLTAGFTFGFREVLSELGDVKGWLDHFIVFFAFLHLIRDGAMARRVVVYLMLGAALGVALGAHEWLDKRWLDSIEKARLLGPQLQPNDFGAFLVYGAAPFLGLFLTQLGRIRVWVLVPYFLLLARILLATFSRGAFIGIAAAWVAAAHVRGRAFLLAGALLAAGVVVSLPQLVPESLSARVGTTTGDTDDQLDTSSQTRLVLWKAAVAMSLESPLLGKGFRSFPRLKDRYTEVGVPESDNHNMFLYISSQMGIPALLLFLWLLFRTYRLGVRIYRSGGDPFRRAIGMGGAALVGGVLGVNLFGSRMVDLAIDAYFWIYLAALAHLWAEIEAPPQAAAGRDAPSPWPWRARRST